MIPGVGASMRWEPKKRGGARSIGVDVQLNDKLAKAMETAAEANERARRMEEELRQMKEAMSHFDAPPQFGTPPQFPIGLV